MNDSEFIYIIQISYVVTSKVDHFVEKRDKTNATPVLGSFDTNSFFGTNVKIFKRNFFQLTKFCEGK